MLNDKCLLYTNIYTNNKEQKVSEPNPLYELAQDVAYITKYPLPVPVYSTQHTHLTRVSPSNQSIQFIIFLTMLYFYYIFIAFYYILYYSLRRHFRQNSRPFLAPSSTFRCWVC
jgi:hypothetical protein